MKYLRTYASKIKIFILVYLLLLKVKRQPELVRVRHKKLKNKEPDLEKRIRKNPDPATR
jgi:hypothetical protein